jgi:hypothetical protein
VNIPNRWINVDSTGMNMVPPKDAAQLLIPGAYDRTTLTHRQPGSMGGGSFGSGMPIGPSSMDAATIAERELEGGGLRRTHAERERLSNL